MTTAQAFADAMRLVRGARAEAASAELHRLERCGLSPAEAARAVGRNFQHLDDATLRRHAEAVVPLLARLAENVRAVEEAVAALGGAPGDPTAARAETGRGAHTSLNRDFLREQIVRR